MKKSKTNFHSYIVTWKQLEKKLGKTEYQRFLEWMNGQTTPEKGVYEWDLVRFLNNQPVID